MQKNMQILQNNTQKICKTNMQNMQYNMKHAKKHEIQYFHNNMQNMQNKKKQIMQNIGVEITCKICTEHFAGRRAAA